MLKNDSVMEGTEVLFMSTTLPSHSEYVYHCRLTSPPNTYLRPYPVVPHRYLNTCFSTTHCTCPSSTVNWVRVLTTEEISFPMLTRYINDLISYLKIVGSTESKYEAKSISIFIFSSIGVAMGLQSIILNIHKILTMYFP